MILYIGTLLVSVVAYRLSPWHPLASIPGPKVSYVSRILSSVVRARGYHHLYLNALLLKYGKFVRIGINFARLKTRDKVYIIACYRGPNHVVSTEASAIPIVLGAKPFRKSDRKHSQFIFKLLGVMKI